MRSLGTSFYLLTVAIGTYMATALNLIVAAITKDNLWVADNPLFGHYDYYFWLNVVILAIGSVAYMFVARRYKEKPILDRHEVRAEGGLVARGKQQAFIVSQQLNRTYA